MRLGERIRWLISYSWNDLFERSVRRGTLSVLCIVFSVVALVTLAFGLVYGIRDASIVYFNNRPQLRSIPFGHVYIGDEFSTKRIEEISENLSQRGVSIEKVVGHRINGAIRFVDRDDPGYSTKLPPMGRTIADDSPLWSEIERLILGQGIIITGAFRKRFCNPHGPFPESFSCRNNDNELVSIPVAGRIHTMDEQILFLIPEGFELELSEMLNPRPLPSVVVGPLPDFMHRHDYIRSIQDEFRSQMISRKLVPRIESVPLSENSSERGWKLESRAGMMFARSEWNAILNSVNDWVTSIDGNRYPGIENIHPSSVQPTDDMHDRIIDDVIIYVKTIDDLKPALNVLESDPYLSTFQIGKDNAVKIDEMNSQFRLMFFVVFGLSIIVTGVSAYNIYTTLVLRSERLIQPIGMLKTMGMESNTFTQIYMTEGLLIWLLSSIPALVLSAIIGPWVASLVKKIAEGGLDATGADVTGFTLPPFVVLSILIASGCICILGVYFATNFARKASPQECLSANL